MLFIESDPPKFWTIIIIILYVKKLWFHKLNELAYRHTECFHWHRSQIYTYVLSPYTTLLSGDLENGQVI